MSLGAGTSRADSVKNEKKDVQIHIFTKNLEKSQAVVAWWKGRGHWALFAGHKKCWELTIPKRERTCTHARANFRAHLARAKRLDVLLHPPPPVYGMMNSICTSSCISCESGWNPMAWNGNDYWGLYQFAYGTWVSHGGDPAMYGKADASTQHLVASRITYDAWPNC